MVEKPETSSICGKNPAHAEIRVHKICVFLGRTVHACGYYLVKHYLKKTGKNIVEATLLPASEILETVEDFWNE